MQAEGCKILNGKTIQSTLVKDLKEIKQSVIIASPKLYHIEKNRYIRILKELHTNGFEVSILTVCKGEESEYLKSHGFNVKWIKDLSLCTCIMDKSNIWYGSINLLEFQTEEDNMIRATDFKLASEIIETHYEKKR